MGGRTLDQFRSIQRANAKKNKTGDASKSSDQENYKKEHSRDSEQE